MLGPVVVVIGGLAVVAAPLAKPKAVKKFTCIIKLAEQTEPGQMAPNPAASKGHDFGIVTCPKPYGQGVQSDSFTVTPNAPPTTGKVKGPYKWFFDEGTVHGPYHLTYSVISPTAVTYTGTAQIAGGTGAFKHTKGSVKLNCSSNDGGIHTTCTGKVTLTHL
jgi:hypothetical protein